MSVEPLHITYIEAPPFAPLPPRGLHLVPPLVEDQPELALRLTPPAPDVLALALPARIHADPVQERILGAAIDPDDESDPRFARRATPRAELPDPLAWSARFSQAALEVIAGRRTPMQLMRWTNRSVYTQLCYRPGMITGRVSLRRVRVCEPADGIAEASIVATFHDRAHAIAARFEGLDGRWLCTALTAELGKPRR